MTATRHTYTMRDRMDAHGAGGAEGTMRGVGAGERVMEETVSIEGKILRESDAAWLISCHAGEIWLPKSQCEMTQWDGVSDNSFDVPIWLAEKKGLA